MRYNKENQLLEFIKEFQNTNGYPPTVREMCHAIKVNSTSTIAYYLNKLEKSGQIRKSPYKNRALEILNNDNTIEEDSAGFLRVPVLGTVTCGEPILAVENIEDYFKFTPNMFHGDNLFILTAKGDSMIGAGIYSGDKLVIEQTPTCEDGEIAAVLLDGEATVKRFFRENGKFRLQPENDAYSPIIVDNCTILGKVIGLVRKF